jgi:hypothetical protein
MQKRQLMITHRRMAKPMSEIEWIELIFAIAGQTVCALSLKNCPLMAGIHRPILNSAAAY